MKKRNLFFTLIILLFAVADIVLFRAIIIALNSKNNSSGVKSAASIELIENDIEAQKKIVDMFAKAYPDIITSVKFLNNDWTMKVNGKLFYCAHGRFLPEKLHKDWGQYLPYNFYVYPWVGTDEERLAVYENPIYSTGSSFLFDAIFNSPNEDDCWEIQEKYSFIGVKLLIHPYIKEALDRVQKRITLESLANSEIREWLAELRTVPVQGWMWRNIAGTERRSNHSYGTAIDLLPKNLNDRSTYWRWDMRKGTTIPKNLYRPPEAAVKAFEDNGFVWGGKWDILDTMHFEYRPEILLLNNFEVFTK